MNKVILTLLFAVSLTSAQAAEKEKILSDKTYACISDKATGFDWSGSQWQAKQFEPYGKFMLNIMIIGTSKEQYIHFNLNGDAVKMHCGQRQTFDFESMQHCMQLGMSIAFSEENERGGVSYLGGATSADNKRDSLIVMPFTCQKF